MKKNPKILARPKKDQMKNVMLFHLFCSFAFFPSPFSDMGYSFFPSTPPSNPAVISEKSFHGLKLRGIIH